ncbi:MAG: KpsF/GutQ family sugar-phosphate isomerase [Thermodesulfobacteriota bacterium]
MIVEQAKEVLKIEAEGILDLVEKISDSFAHMVELIYRSNGRVVMAGIGKSGLIAQKIVATLNSTGTRALFLHPVEAMHGDLGIVGRDDVLIAISNSGETDELNVLIPNIRQIGCKVIAFTGKPTSTLARLSDIVIDVGVKKEACPLGMVPTASTTAVLAMGDALAVTLINKRKFNLSDFRKFHPGGALGQRLLLKVTDIMLTGDDVPKIPAGSGMKTALAIINQLKLGVVLVVAEKGVLTGIITDGDIRRIITQRNDILSLTVEAVMTPTPLTIGMETPVYDALNIMEEYQITVLPVTNPDNVIQGILHLHDILGKGAFKFNGS